MTSFDEYQRLCKQTDKCTMLYCKCETCNGAGEIFILLDDSMQQCSTCKGEGYIELPWAYPTIGLAGETGEVTEKIKKTIRDDGGIMQPERKDLLLKELGDCMWYIAMISEKNGIKLSEVAEANLDKLFSRKERGVLSGDGDAR